MAGRPDLQANKQSGSATRLMMERHAKLFLGVYSEDFKIMGIKATPCTQRRSFSYLLPHSLQITRMDVDGIAALKSKCADPCTNQGQGRLLGAQRDKRSNSRKERVVQTTVAAALRGARMEVPCKVGVVDILTDDLVIEVKHCTQWKQALGQCLAYRECFPSTLCMQGTALLK
jgi:hypothetical protein